MNKQIIYDMPSEEYHKLERLSSSGIKKLIISSQDFYKTSWMNKNKREHKSDAFNLGTAYHTAILEGLDVFNSRYAIEPVCDKRTTAGKNIFNQWKENNPDCTPISEETYDDIIESYVRVQEVTDLFRDGRSEVTILWNDEETNVPMKARLDYKKPSILPDLKTFSNSNGMDINRLIARHVVQYQYFIQQAVYREAVEEECSFPFVFVQTQGICNVLVKEFPSDLLLADKGRVLMRQGINKFRDQYMKYGVNPWYDGVSNDSFKDEDFPLYVFES